MSYSELFLCHLPLDSDVLLNRLNSIGITSGRWNSFHGIMVTGGISLVYLLFCELLIMDANDVVVWHLLGRLKLQHI